MSDIPIVIPELGAEEIAQLEETIHSRWIGQGPKVAALEAALAEKHGCSVVAVHSGTAALHLALIAAGVGPGDQVILPAFSFVATANVIELVGATPIFVDINPRTFNMDSEQLKELVGKSVKPAKAALIVHEFGLTAHMQPIIQCLTEADTMLIEDAACAYMAKYKGDTAGNFGAMACYSLHPRKLMTSGEGGYIIAKDQQHLDACRILRSHGLENGDVKRVGLNYRMSDLQAAVGLAQLQKVERFLKRRRDIAKAYDSAFSGNEGLIRPHVPEGFEHCYQSYVVRLRCDKPIEFSALRKRRNNVIGHCHQHGVLASIAAYNMPGLTYYKEKYGLDAEDFPGSYEAEVGSIALPIYPEMSDVQIKKVVDTLTDALQKVSS